MSLPIVNVLALAALSTVTTFVITRDYYMTHHSRSNYTAEQTTLEKVEDLILDDIHGLHTAIENRKELINYRIQKACTSVCRNKSISIVYNK